MPIEKHRELNLHDMAIEQISKKYDGIQKRGLFNKCRDIIRSYYSDIEGYEDEEKIYLIEEYINDFNRLERFTPDGFIIQNNKIILIEIEDTSKMSKKKLFDIGWFWGYFDYHDEFDIDVELLVFDRYGKNETKLNPMDYYYNSLIEESKKRKIAEKAEKDKYMADREHKRLKEKEVAIKRLLAKGFILNKSISP